MNAIFTNKMGRILLASGFAGAMAAPAAAQTCSVKRAFPGVEDIVTISCQHFAPGTHTATTADVGVRSVAGVKRTTSNLSAGGTTGKAVTTALDASGNTIASCTATDSAKDSTAVEKTCSSASKWVGTLTFDE
jgi:hypothetical protein